MPETSERLLNRIDMAKRLGISPRHLFNLTKSGKVPCITLGKVVRYDPVDVIESLKRQSMEGCI